jgi:hypothetical protein
MVRFISVIVAALVAATGCQASEEYHPKNGDIVFHESKSSQSRAIQIVTGSRYSHMGVIRLVDGRPFVFEAIGHVTSTPLDQWATRGRNGHLVVKRLRNADEMLDEQALRSMFEIGASMKGAPYDLHFEWSDDRVYCSELVWKIYHRALGVKLTDFETFSDFDLDDPEVLSIVEQRWPGGPPPEEPVVSPRAIFESPLLVTVFEN